jgi:arylsulfatase A-like enzyme
MRAWISRAAGLFAGASLAALIGAALGGTAFPFWALLMPITVGNWLVAFALALLLLPCSLVRAWGPRLGGCGLWAAVGCAAGLVPVPAQLGAPLALGLALGGGLAVALVLAAHKWLPPLPTWSAILVVILTPGWSLASAFYHDDRLDQALRATAERKLQLPGAPPQAEPPPGAPDLILVSLDTLRADAVVGPRPHGFVTPFLDSLRESGTWWDFGLSSSNQTLPGHASMLMGRDAMGTAVRWNRDSLPGPEHAPLLAQRFLAAGFRTAGVISNGLLSAAMGFDRGFELYDDTTVPRFAAVNLPIEYHQRSTWFGILLDASLAADFFSRSQYFSSTKAPRGLGGVGQVRRGEVTTDQAIAALGQLYAQDRAFFFFVHYIDPHQPYGAPPPYAGRLTRDLPPVPARYAPSRMGLFAQPEVDRAGVDLASSDPEVRAAAELAIRWFHATYLERVMYLDSQLARLHARVVASGRPAVWLVTADHGEHFGEHGAVMHGTSLYEELVRVPFFLAGPGIPAQHAEGNPHLEDVPPTLLALAGIVPSEDELAGRILSLEGAGAAGRPHIATDNRRIAARAEDWKALGHWTSETEAIITALFRLDQDATEQRNRFDPAVTPWEAILKDFLGRDLYPQRSRQTLDFAQRMLLSDLGYVEAAAE